MAVTKPTSGSESTEQPGNRPAAAYEKPQIILKEPLEAVAAACTPAPPGKSFGVCALASS